MDTTGRVMALLTSATSEEATQLLSAVTTTVYCPASRPVIELSAMTGLEPLGEAVPSPTICVPPVPLPSYQVKVYPVKSVMLVPFNSTSTVMLPPFVPSKNDPSQTSLVVVEFSVVTGI